MIDFFNKLYKVTEKEFFSEMKSNLSRNNKMFIVTANPEAFMYGGNDIEVKNYSSGRWHWFSESC